MNRVNKVLARFGLVLYRTDDQVMQNLTLYAPNGRITVNSQDGKKPAYFINNRIHVGAKRAHEQIVLQA